MNQFRLDLDATRCAQAHQDAHCGKMLLELVQQLCTAFVEPDLLVKANRRGDSWLFFDSRPFSRANLTLTLNNPGCAPVDWRLS